MSELIRRSQETDVEVDRIVEELDEGVHELPVDAIREVREHRELMVPRLIEVLRKATSSAAAGNLPEGNAHFLAIFLLTELKAEEAFPAILDAFSLPGELPFELFNDAVTSTLARILAQFAGDRPEVMDGMIGNRELNEYVRWEAAQSYVHLVRDGRLTREEAVRRLEELLRQAIDRSDEEVCGGLICVLVSFAPKEALATVEEAFRRNLVDSELVDMDCVQRSIDEGEQRIQQELEWCRPTGIADTIEELQNWASFREKPDEPSLRVPLPGSLPTEDFKEVAEPVPAVEEPRGPRVGRNAPCPCDSGKKFKKCCGARK